MSTIAAHRPFAGRVAVVTGASRGIGAAAAEALAAAGAHVVALARTVGALEELDDRIKAGGGSATLVPLDLRDGPGLDMLGPALHEKFGRVDILLANAGQLGVLTPTSQIDPVVWNDTLMINLTANWLLIRTLAPLLLAAEAGRAIFVTSGAAARPRAFWGAYAASKAGLEALVKCWAEEVKNTRLRVNLLDPGATRTVMRAQAFPGEDPASLKPPEALIASIFALADPACVAHGTVVPPPTAKN